MQSESIINQIYKRFNIIDNRNQILLHNLGLLNQFQNELILIQTDISENSLYYDRIKKDEVENKNKDKQIEISTLAFRCIEDMEHLIIETSNVLELYNKLEDKREVNLLLSNKFTPFIQGISNLETLFLSKIDLILELKSKVNLFGQTLQNVICFDIVME
jgi:hypothetical protein